MREQPSPTRMTGAHFDFIVLGGGSGGSACARRAAEYGARVCIVDRGPSRDATGSRTGAGFGGTCVNVGCVPKKLMWLATSLRESVVGPTSLASGYGLNVPDHAGKVDWAALKKRRDAYVAGLNNSYEGNWTKAGIEVVVGAARFLDPHTIQVDSDDGSSLRLTAAKVLIAVGGSPKLPRIPGIELAISSDGFFDLPSQPRKVAVVGAGYIAVEMAQILHGMGSEVHLFFRGATVLRHGFDPFVVETLMAEMKAHGPALHPASTPVRLVSEGSTTTLVISSADGTEHEHRGFECVLMATGREPNTSTLGLASVGVEQTSTGHVVVDAFENTSVADIFAVGDVTSTGFELTPVAIASGRRLADRLFGGEPRARIEYSAIATVVFSHPPIGTIGLTEPQARDEFGSEAITVKEARFNSMMYAFNDANAKVKTAMKLVLCGPEEKVVGLHCIGPHSDEMLQGFAVAVRMGATRADFEACVAIHPTIAEEFVTFGGWGQSKDKDRVTGKKVPVLPPYIAEPTGARAKAMSAAFATGTLVGAAATVGLLWFNRP